ncbi:MAG: glycosyltransferase family 4 protein [Thermoleophilaceae bacterium]
MATPRTVVYLHSSAGRYGADLQLAALAGGLDRARFVPVCVLPERGELAGMLEERGAEVVVRPLAVLRRGLVNPGGLAALAGGLRRDRGELGALARERGAAVVHANTSVVLGGGAAARAAGAAHVVHVREIYTGAANGAAGRLWPLLRRRLERADALLCVSGAVAAQFRRRATVVHDGLLRVPEPAARAEARRVLDVPEGRFAVALLGRVSDWKGQDVLARALAEPVLAKAGAVGLIAGDAFPGNEQMERELAELGARLGLGDRLRLLGFRDDVENVLGAADAVAVPSTRPDPLPNSALEAAAAGLCVVAAAHGGLTEIVRDGETGLLTPPGDHVALAAALARLAADAALARRLGEAAAADARERFALPRMLDEVQAVYEHVLARARPRRTHERPGAPPYTG